MSTKPTIVILGAGKMGQVIASCVRQRAQAVYFWDIDESKVVGQPPLSATLPKASFVFLCVPSFAVRAAAQKAIPLLKRSTAFITVAKGIEESSGLTMAELLHSLLAKHHHAFALLSGPMLADEFTLGQQGFGVLGGLNKATYKKIAALFDGSVLSLSYSSDVFGVAYAGVLKNIYALGLGMLHGMQQGKNVQGWYVAQAMHEMRGILHALGAHPSTAESWAGLADLVTTGFSESSRNFSVGVAIAKKEHTKFSEGTRSLPIVYAKIGRRVKKFPLLQHLYAIVVHKQSAKQLLIR